MNLGDVRGLYPGRTAVVLGSGPSLRFIDSRLRKHVVIAVNDAFSKAPWADYYFTADPSMTQHWHWDEVVASNCVAVVEACGWKFVGPKMSGVPKDLILRYERHAGLRMRQKDGKLVMGPSSAHCAVSFAVVLGCTRIYLIGCDCRCEDGKKYYWEFNNQPKGGLKTGEATWYIKESKRVKRKIPKTHFDPWYMKDGTPAGDAVNGWGALVKTNRDVKIIDASGRKGGGALAEAKVMPGADVLTVMGKRK